MEKVRLPREVATAIEEFYRCEETNKDILAAVLGNANSKSSHTLRSFAKDDGHFNFLMEALVNGYEVEETTEDKVRELYEYLGQESIHYASEDIQNKIQIMLNLLNIKIEGVNT